jgi:hypothetical protein
MSYAIYKCGGGVQGSVVPVNTCEGVSCRPGRECVQLTNGENECVCMARCPDHWKPVSRIDKYSTDSERQWIRIGFNAYPVPDPEFLIAKNKKNHSQKNF